MVAGAGRSGTSTFAGLARIAGLRVPQPEVEADPTNPKGFAEPRWLVDLHDGLLADVGVQVSDSRPVAWRDTAGACDAEPVRREAARWLSEQLGPGGDLLLKDPRLGFFVPLWRVAALRAGARAAFVTVLRPPGEVVVSKQTYYDNRLGAAHLAASWLNMQLHVEHATRTAGPRAFVRYTDLLADWVPAVAQVGRTLDLPALQDPGVERVREGNRFVDPSLRRMQEDLGALGVPDHLRELVEETWRTLDGLADADGDTPATHAVLDGLRAAYVDLYAEAEAISRSSVVAVRHRRRVAEARVGPGRAVERAAPRHGADVVPHRLRALVPGTVRRALRRAAGRPRSSPPG